MMKFISFVREITEKITEWSKDYNYLPHKNEFVNLQTNGILSEKIKEYFTF